MEGYRDQRHTERASANWRFNIQSDDLRALYRRHYRESHGIDISITAENNIENWLNPESKFFKKTLRDAVFHYAARTEKKERIKVCISTSEMRDAAWRYCHQRQLVLDGTFGLCNSRVLLWIAMGVDDSNRGIPVALFLFSAPTGNQATHAGYDTNIITELLESWRDWLNRSRPASESGSFEPFAAMTDTDTKERAALLRIWPAIVLLLCKFHVRQCWTSKRSSLTKGLSPHWCATVEKRLYALEEAYVPALCAYETDIDQYYSRRLLDTIHHEDALRLIAVEEKAFAMLSAIEPESAKAVQAITTYIAYLRKIWMPMAMWSGWSRRGREDAAARMGVKVEVILTTSNHLESFNGRLKNHYIPQWQHSGHRLRLDILVYFLITNILPRIFAQQRLLTDYALWLSKRFPGLAPSIDSKDPRSAGQAPGPRTLRSTPSHPATGFVPRTWYAPDTKRDMDARMIYNGKYLTPQSAGRPYELWARCMPSRLTLSSHTPDTDSSALHPTSYFLTVHPSGSASCTCLDWLGRGGACKHLRAFRLLVELWRDCGTLPGPFIFPSTEDEARDIEARNRKWYGSQYDRAVTYPGGPPLSDGAVGAEPDASSPQVRPTAVPCVIPSESTAAHAERASLLPPSHLGQSAEAVMQQVAEFEGLMETAEEGSEGAAVSSGSQHEVRRPYEFRLIFICI